MAVAYEASQSQILRDFNDATLARVVVAGVGGAGTNIVSRLVEEGILGAECIAINTDRAHLDVARADEKLLIGAKTTGGLGAGGNPRVGRRAAQESTEALAPLFDNVDVVFVTAGMGGGTGTGAAPLVAEFARQSGAIVISVVTMPFAHEKAKRGLASQGVAEIRKVSDTVVIVDNNRFVGVLPTLLINAPTAPADEAATTIIKGLAETIATPSLMNLDFGGFRTIARNGGLAHLGIGESRSLLRAEEAAMCALRCPLPYTDIRGASGVLVSVSGDDTLSLHEASRVADLVAETVGPTVSVAWGARVDRSIYGAVRVSVLLTGTVFPYIPGGYRRLPFDMYEMEPESGEDEKLSLDLGLDQLEAF